MPLGHFDFVKQWNNCKFPGVTWIFSPLKNGNQAPKPKLYMYERIEGIMRKVMKHSLDVIIVTSVLHRDLVLGSARNFRKTRLRLMDC